jgi:hypothetical protein
VQVVADVEGREDLPGFCGSRAARSKSITASNRTGADPVVDGLPGGFAESLCTVVILRFLEAEPISGSKR